MKKFTPGPWVVLDSWIYGTVSSKCESKAICRIGVSHPIVPQASAEEDEANAQLIATAPELVVALESVVRALTEAIGYLDDYGFHDHTDGLKLKAEHCKIILQKAKGEK